MLAKHSPLGHSEAMRLPGKSTAPACLVSALLLASPFLAPGLANAQAGEFGTFEGEMGRDGELAAPGMIAQPDAGDAPSIGSVGMAAGENIPDAGDAPSIGSVGIPAGEGELDAGDAPSIGESSSLFD